MITCKQFLALLSKQIYSQHSKVYQTFFNPIIKSQYLSKSILYRLSSIQQEQFVFNSQNQPDLHKLQLQYRRFQNFSIFQSSIKTWSGILDQTKIFKIFKVLEKSSYKQASYEQFFESIMKNVNRKSDSILLLLATIKEKQAKNFKKQKDIYITIKILEQALNILQQCLIPPLLPYYSIYREYGLLHDELGEKQKAKQILTEAVQIIDDFVNHSDDSVYTNDYCKKQATAFNVLARIDPKNSLKWITKANNIWQKFTQNKFNEIEYAKTIAISLNKQFQQNRQKGQAFYYFNLYKFQTKQLKDLIQKAKQKGKL